MTAATGTFPGPVAVRTVVTAAGAAYAANCALGAAVALKVVDTSGFRWVHHGLYIATASLSAVAVVTSAAGVVRAPNASVATRTSAGLLLIPAAVPLTVIPRIGARTRRHVDLALSIAPFMAAALIRAWR